MDLLAKPVQQGNWQPPRGAGGGIDLLAQPPQAEQPQEEGSWFRRNVWEPIVGLPKLAVGAGTQAVLGTAGLAGQFGASAIGREDWAEKAKGFTERVTSDEPIDLGGIYGKYTPPPQFIKPSGLIGDNGGLQQPFTGEGSKFVASKGLEAASWLVGLPEAKTAITAAGRPLVNTVRSVMLQGARAGGQAGFLQGASAELGKPESGLNLETAKNVMNAGAMSSLTGMGVGGILGFGFGVAGTALNRQYWKQAARNNLFKLLRPSSKQIVAMNAGENNAINFIADYMIKNDIHGFGLDPTRGLDVLPVVTRLDDEALQISNSLDEYHKLNNTRVSLNDFRDRALAEIDTPQNKATGSEYSAMVRAVNEEVKALKNTYGNEGNTVTYKGTNEPDVMISMSDFNRVKQQLWKRLSQARAFATPEVLNRHKTKMSMGHVAKTIIEENTPDALIKDYNKYLGSLINAREFLEGKSGKQLPGGRLGRYMARLLGAAAGSKGGPVGSAIGMLAADRIEQAIQSPKITNSILAAFIRQAEQDTPGVTEMIEKNLGAKLSEILKKRTVKPPGVSGDISPVTPKPLDLRGRVRMPKEYQAALDALAMDPTAADPATRQALIDAAQSPQGRAYVKQTVGDVPTNPDGTITVHVIGSPADGDVLSVPDAMMAREVSQERIARGLDGTITAIKVNPSQARAVIPTQTLPEIIIGTTPDAMGLPQPRVIHPSMVNTFKEQFKLAQHEASPPESKKILGNVGTATFEESTYSKKFIERKNEASGGTSRTGTKGMELTRHDPAAVHEMLPYIADTKEAYVSGQGDRAGNIAWVANMPDGSTRVVITAQASNGNEVVINGPWTVTQKYLDDTFRPNGPADPARTGFGLDVERQQLPTLDPDTGMPTLPAVQGAAQPSTTGIAQTPEMAAAAGIPPAPQGQPIPIEDITRRPGGGGAQLVPDIPEGQGTKIPIAGPPTGFKAIRLKFFDKYVDKGVAEIPKESFLNDLKGFSTDAREKEIIAKVVADQEGKIDIQKTIDTIENEEIVQYEPTHRVTEGSSSNGYTPPSLAAQMKLAGGKFVKNESDSNYGTRLERHDSEIARSIGAQGTTELHPPFAHEFTSTHSSQHDAAAFTRWSWLKGDVNAKVLAPDGTQTGVELKLDGDKIVLLEEIQSDPYQRADASLRKQYEDALAEFGGKIPEGNFDQFIGELRADAKKMSLSRTFQSLYENIENTQGDAKSGLIGRAS